MRRKDPPWSPVNSEVRTWAQKSNYQTTEERIDPGGQGRALLGRWVDDLGGRYIFEDNIGDTSTGKSEITIYDPFEHNFVLPFEIVPVVWRPRPQRWEIEGSWGLERDAKVSTSYGIPWLSSGSVSLYFKRGQISPNQDVAAHFTWMGATGDNLTLNTECLIKYKLGKHLELGRWEIINAGCA